MANSLNSLNSRQRTWTSQKLRRRPWMQTRNNKLPSKRDLCTYIGTQSPATIINPALPSTHRLTIIPIRIRFATVAAHCKCAAAAAAALQARLEPSPHLGRIQGAIGASLPPMSRHQRAERAAASASGGGRCGAARGRRYGRRGQRVRVRAGLSWTKLGIDYCCNLERFLNRYLKLCASNPSESV